MDYRKKIKTKAELASLVAGEKARNRTVVLCHGCFDILHPGHIRHLAWAKEQGDVLVVTVSADAVVGKGPGRPFVPEKLRAENLAAIGFVDHVSIDNGSWAGPVIKLLKPDIFIKGKEFERVFTGRIGKEREIVHSYGGKVLFSSGDVVYSSTDIYENKRGILHLPDERMRTFRERNHITADYIRSFLKSPARPHILVCGDVVISEETSCIVTGCEARDGAVHCKAVRANRHMSGAASVARSLSLLGAETALITVAGDDEAGAWLQNRLREETFKAQITKDQTRPTALRRCFRTGSREMFTVNNFQSHPLEPGTEKSLLELMRGRLEGSRAALAVDCAAGALTPGVMTEMKKYAGKRGFPFLGVSSPLSGMTNLHFFSGTTAVTADENSLRQMFCDTASGIADLAVKAADRLKNRNLLVCLSDGGSLILTPSRRHASGQGHNSYEMKAEAHISNISLSSLRKQKKGQLRRSCLARWLSFQPLERPLSPPVILPQLPAM